RVTGPVGFLLGYVRTDDQALPAQHAAKWITGEGPHRPARDLDVCRGCAVHGGSVKLFPIAEPEDSKHGFAQLRSLLEHCREHRLEIAGRTRYDLKHLRGRRLL